MYVNKQNTTAEPGQQTRFGTEFKPGTTQLQSGSLPPRGNEAEPEITPNEYTEVQRESRVQFRSDLP